MLRGLCNSKDDRFVMKYQEIAWTEMRPDVYGGDTCDKIIPQFCNFSDGDKDEDTSDDVTFLAKNFPAGTKITVKVPECPKCQMDAMLCQELGDCDFDWKKWTEENYS